MRIIDCIQGYTLEILCNHSQLKSVQKIFNAQAISCLLNLKIHFNFD